MYIVISILTFIPIIVTLGVLYANIGVAEFAGYYFLVMVIIINLIIIKRGLMYQVLPLFLR
jgi:hypothetical protein